MSVCLALYLHSLPNYMLVMCSDFDPSHKHNRTVWQFTVQELFIFVDDFWPLFALAREFVSVFKRNGRHSLFLQSRNDTILNGYRMQK